MNQLKIIHDDITRVTADAIVNSANPFPICGGSTEALIFDAAGHDQLLEAREKIGYLDVCDVAHTDAFDLNAKYIIHVSAPRWNDGRSGEKTSLKFCYQNAMRKARELGCHSIAFPLLSSGIYRFPKDLALDIAKESIEEFLLGDGKDCDITATIVLYDDEAVKISEALFGKIQEYIYANYVPENPQENFEALKCCSFSEEPLGDGQMADDSQIIGESEVVAEICDAAPILSKISSKSDFDKSINELLKDPKRFKSFRKKMNEIMTDRSITNSMLARDSDVDRKVLSKINNSDSYTPSKETAIAIAIGLKLNYIEAVEFLSYAGRALSPSSKSDLIVQFFMENKELFYRENPDRNQYKVNTLNTILSTHGENSLGASRSL